MANLPDDLAASVIGWGQENIPENDLYKDPNEAGLGRENEPHVTVLYGIHETNVRKVKTLIENEKPFEIRLGNIGIFSHNEIFDVVKINVTSKQLNDLNKVLKDELSHKNLYPIYSPHVTIAYVKKGRAKSLEDDSFFAGKKFPVKQVVFSSKNGSKCLLTLKGLGADSHKT
jgi:2'-5' RNA ligase